jgi:hypothetical protein
MSIFNSIGSYFKALGLSLFGQLKASIASFLNDFVKDDLGKLAVDAVTYVNDSMPNSPSNDKRDAAKAKLIADLKAAGHDVSVFGESVLNFLIEAAVQAVLAAAGNGVAALAG